MPRQVDIRLQIRNRLWAWLVYACTGSRSWDALDKHWLAKIDSGFPTEKLVQPREGRRRVFHQIFRQGINPERMRGANGKNLLEVVTADPSQAEATSLYDSPLWIMLGENRLSSAELKAVHIALLDKLNFVQLTDIEVDIGKCLSQEHPALQLDDINVTQRAARDMTKLRSADGIALLCCEYKLAIDNLSLKKADVYLGAIAEAIRRFEIRWQTHGGVVGNLRTLIEMRILRNFPEPIAPEMLGIKKRRRGAASHATLIDRFQRIEDYPQKLLLRPSKDAPTVKLDSWLEEFFFNYAAHYGSYVTDMAKKLALDQDLKRCAEGASLEEAIEFNKSIFPAPVVRPKFA